MSNSSRWRRLCEWVRHLEDTKTEIDLHCLVDKMEDIKRGGGDYVLREKQTSDRWAEKAKLIVNSMALIGYNEFYEDSPADMEDGKIEAYRWRKIALNMLKNIKFPAELYQICNAIACMSDDKLEEMLK